MPLKPSQKRTQLHLVLLEPSQWFRVLHYEYLNRENLVLPVLEPSHIEAILRHSLQSFCAQSQRRVPALPAPP